MEPLFLAEVRIAGATLSVGALESVAHTPADVALVKRCVEAGGTPMHGAKVLNATFNSGAWKVVIVSGLTLQEPNPVRNFPAIRTAWEERAGQLQSDQVLGPVIDLLAGLCELDLPERELERGRRVSVACERLGQAAESGGRNSDAYDLAMLGLSTGASEGRLRLPLARRALKLAERHGGEQRKAVSAVEVALALVATGAEAEAISAATLAVRALKNVPVHIRQPLAQRLLDVAQTCAAMTSIVRDLRALTTG